MNSPLYEMLVGPERASLMQQAYEFRRMWNVSHEFIEEDIRNLDSLEKKISVMTKYIDGFELDRLQDDLKYCNKQELPEAVEKLEIKKSILAGNIKLTKTLVRKYVLKYNI